MPHVHRLWCLSSGCMPHVHRLLLTCCFSDRSSRAKDAHEKLSDDGEAGDVCDAGDAGNACNDGEACDADIVIVSVDRSSQQCADIEKLSFS